MASTDTTTRVAAAAASANGAGEDGFEVRNPATGDAIASLPMHDAEDVRAAAQRLRAAQPEWEALGTAGRYRWLARWRDWIFDNADGLIEVMVAETGKVRHDAALEHPHVADMINFYGKGAAKFLADEELSPHAPLMKSKAVKVVYRPQPVVGIIGPWNFPLMLTAADAIPALCAGSAVLFKPSEFTPLSLLEIVRGWKEDVGGPDVMEVVTGFGDTGSAVVDEVDFVHFTGSVATGKKVMARAAETLTALSLELGGKDPMIVLDDADVERAANAAAWGGLANSGQICISVERVYVEEPVYDEFLARLIEKVRAVRQGPDEPAFTKDIGAMTSPNQAAIVEEHLRDAVERGADVLVGGRRREGPGDYFEPTVLAGVDHDMKVMRDETFGPVIPVMKVRDDEEAIRLANDSRYGLGASVFGRDRERAERVARRIEAGGCNVNDVMIHYLISDAPMGGWKESGVGARHGVDGIRKFCRRETITISRLTPKSEALWFPYGKRKGQALKALTRLFNARGLRNRLGLPRR
jgi:acyl-CoA reductase-like NAD-dependent aldehyde dehydrogenase